MHRYSPHTAPPHEPQPAPTTCRTGTHTSTGTAMQTVRPLRYVRHTSGVTAMSLTTSSPPFSFPRSYCSRCVPLLANEQQRNIDWQQRGCPPSRPGFARLHNTVHTAEDQRTATLGPRRSEPSCTTRDFTIISGISKKASKMNDGAYTVRRCRQAVRYCCSTLQEQARELKEWPRV